MKNSNNIKVLSIGINNYQSDKITDLNGCVKDAEKVKDFFLNHIGIAPNNYLALFNTEATRQGIISAFRAHFKGLKPGDTAVFHFSGHGSWEQTSDEFIAAKLERYGGRNEVLVCQDSRIGDNYDLADKELRYLIAEAQQNDQGEHITGIHFLCIFDCCHSGSMLRGFNRMHPGNRSKRSLDEYLEGQYAQLTPLRLPYVDFIALTACSHSESALEDDEGGIFTNALITALKHFHSFGKYPSYAELFSTLREFVIQRTRTSQTPHFEYSGEVNPFDTVLKLHENNYSYYPTLLRQDDEWKINIGAIHGIIFEEIENLKILIFHKDAGDQPIGSCRAWQIELEYTVVKQVTIEAAYQHLFSPEKMLAAAWQTTDFNLSAGISGRKLPIQLNISNEASPSATLLSDKIHKSAYLLLANQSSYALHFHAEQLILTGPQMQKIIGINGFHSGLNPLFLHLLFQISKYEQIKQLRNPSNSNVDPDKIVVTFEYRNHDGDFISNQSISVAEDSTPVEVNFVTGNPVSYAIRIKHQNSSPLYFYLLHLDRKFGIKQKNENYLKRCVFNDDRYLYQSSTTGYGLGISDHETQEVEDTFVIIAAVNKLSIPYAFQQPGLGRLYGTEVSASTFLQNALRGTRDDSRAHSWNESNWAVRKVVVKTRRRKK